MRLRPTIAAVTLLLVAPACQQKDGRPSDPVAEPPAVDLTPAERDDFLVRVADLGFACGDALGDASPYVACARPVPPAETDRPVDDLVRLTATADGGVASVSYCGADVAVLAAFSAAFLPELGSPDALPLPATTTGARLRGCNGLDAGFVAGADVAARLRELDVVAVRSALVDAGWECRDGEPLSCTVPVGDDRVVAWGAASGVQASAPSPVSLASAARDLGLGTTVVTAAGTCESATTCSRLVAEGYDIGLGSADGRTRMVITEVPWR